MGEDKVRAKQALLTLAFLGVPIISGAPRPTIV